MVGQFCIISATGLLGAEQNVCYFIDCGPRELKVFSQVIANVLLSMLGFLEDAISDAACDLRRTEASAHQHEQGGSQSLASISYGTLPVANQPR